MMALAYAILHSRTELTMHDVNAAVKIAEKRATENAQFLDPIIIKECVTLQQVLDFISKHDKLPLKVCFIPDKDDGEKNPNKIIGNYIAYDLPRDVHETTADNIISQIRDSISQLINNNTINVNLQLRDSRSSTARLGSGLKEPSAGLRPIQLRIGGNVLDAGFGRPFPNLVVELAFQNESLPRLVDELRCWIGNLTSVQVAIGIKIFDREANGTRRLCALLYRKASDDVQSIEFGTDIGNAHGLRLAFPLADMYVGVHLSEIPFPIQALLATPIISYVDIDLAEVQSVILEELGM
jgi:hypothetical protein